MERVTNSIKLNLKKISVSLKSLKDNEKVVKEKFERLLRGTMPDEVDPEAAGPFSDIGLSSDKVVPISLVSNLNRESLEKRRRDYLASLSSVFKKLEGELFAIEEMRKELEQARVDISIKKEEAFEKKDAFQNQRDEMLKEVKATEVDLEKSLGEEQTLIREFGQILQGVENSVIITEEVDSLLFAHLDEPEPPEAKSPIPEISPDKSNDFKVDPDDGSIDESQSGSL